MVLSKSHGKEEEEERAEQHNTHVVRWEEFCAQTFRPATWRRIQWMRCSVKGAESERFMEGGRPREGEAIRWSYCHCFPAE